MAIGSQLGCAILACRHTAVPYAHTVKHAEAASVLLGLRVAQTSGTEYLLTYRAALQAVTVTENTLL